jgi:hypothetical protein
MRLLTPSVRIRFETRGIGQLTRDNRLHALGGVLIPARSAEHIFGDLVDLAFQGVNTQRESHNDYIRASAWIAVSLLRDGNSAGS